MLACHWQLILPVLLDSVPFFLEHTPEILSDKLHSPSHLFNLEQRLVGQMSEDEEEDNLSALAALLSEDEGQEEQVFDSLDEEEPVEEGEPDATVLV